MGALRTLVMSRAFGKTAAGDLKSVIANPDLALAN